MPGVRERRGGLLVGLLMVLSLAGLVTWTAAPAGADPAAAREIVIKARQFHYEPGIVEVNQGDRVIIRLRAEDVSHGLYLDGYELQVKAEPGEEPQEAVLSFVADRPGRFMFRCSVTCGSFHPYMVGWLRVKPNRFLQSSLALTGLVAAGSISYFWYRRR